MEVTIEDETLRDGLQSESKVLTTEQKQWIFKGLVEAGIRRLQVGSFVHAAYVPQMADTEELISRIDTRNGVLLTGLILNRKGLERALACGLTHLSMSVSASDKHSQRNVRKSADQSLAEMTELIREAVQAGVKVRAGVQCAFGCVYQGPIPTDIVLSALDKMASAGAQELNLADTTGMANPRQVLELASLVQEHLSENKLSLHLHDTRGLGLANMHAGYQAGVRIFDMAAGGLGGCPFVRGAAGNVATEDAVNMFESMGVKTGIRLDKLCSVVDDLQDLFGRRLPGRMCTVLKAAGDCHE